jgi:heat-inducible transcriptional repressor
MKLLNNSTIEIATSPRQGGGTRNDKMINSMTERQEKILKEIIKSYIKLAQPISSECLMGKLGNKVSSATVRNEMAELEAENYLFQPHASAGRIPAEKGYQYYLDHFLEEKDLSQIFARYSKRVISDKKTKEEICKNLAKVVAHLSGEAVIISFSKDNVYYTGIFNLFSQPEFSQFNLIRDFSQIIDNLDEFVTLLYSCVGDEVEISLGRANPFSPQLASILTMAQNKTLLGLIGPMRMDFDKNLALMKSFKNFIED